MKSWMTLSVLLAVAGMVGAASAAEPPVPHVYAAPTVGIWTWDSEALQDLDLADDSGPVYGGRVGYTPISAFSGELVVLTGTNDVRFEGGTAGVRLTQAEVSFLVNFRSLFNTPVFPFLDLGGGFSFRRVGEVPDGEDLDSDHVNFHLGGGLKTELTRELGMRFNFRDTFYTETRGEGTRGEQVTVDAVEVSLALEYRLGLKKGRGPERLR